MRGAVTALIIAIVIGIGALTAVPFLPNALLQVLAAVVATVVIVVVAAILLIAAFRGPARAREPEAEAAAEPEPMPEVAAATATDFPEMDRLGMARVGDKYEGLDVWEVSRPPRGEMEAAAYSTTVVPVGKVALRLEEAVAYVPRA